MTRFLAVTEKEKATDHFFTYPILGNIETLTTQEKENPAVLAPLPAVLGISDNETKILVLTTKNSEYGAIALLYPSVLTRLKEMGYESFFVLPSSIHEVLLLTDKLLTNDHIAHEKELLYMVHDINREEVAPEDRLSDDLLYYNYGKWEVIKHED